MNTITRYGRKSKYVAPESVPAFSRRWQRAMSALNVADDQRYLLDATSQDAAEERSAFESKLVALDRGAHLAALARRVASHVLDFIARSYTEPTSGSIVTNGPNTQPTAHSKFAVGPEVAA